MLARMGGRLISFYSDDIADLLIDDILRDCVKDLNEIEQKTEKRYKFEEASSFVNEMLDNLIGYKNQEHNVELKYRQNPASFYQDQARRGKVNFELEDDFRRESVMASQSLEVSKS